MNFIVLVSKINLFIVVGKLQVFNRFVADDFTGLEEIFLIEYSNFLVCMISGHVIIREIRKNHQFNGFKIAVKVA